MMKSRSVFFEWLLSLSLVVLAGRLIAMQVFQHQYYLTLAQENRIKLIPIPAERGVIYDRRGRILAVSSAAGRDYPLAEAAAAVLGYLGEGERKIVGKDGLERQYNDRLQGKEGAILVETDVAGNQIREISRTDPVSGEAVTTTLDLSLQKKAFELLAGRKGAVVATTSQSGEVLALVSSPGFHPNELIKYLNDPALPLFNRAVGGVYPPGSTFKIITAIAALEEGVAGESTRIEDSGEITVGPQKFGNWYYRQYGRTEGVLDLVGALKRSNDIFFYRLGEELGSRRLSEWAKFFGVGSLTGIDLGGEAEGLMPDPVWKKTVKKEDWYLGDTIINAIGQGDVLMTPLQVNTMMSVIASNGKWCRPFLVIRADCRKLDISPKSIELVARGLEAVTQTGGTAFPFFDFKVNGEKVKVAGKTGTAEFGDPQNKTHAWFSGFVSPADAEALAGKPGVVVTVLLEGAGEGSSEAAPVAKELLSYWFNQK